MELKNIGLEDTKYGDILCVNSSHLAGLTIRLFTESPIDHVAACIGNDKIIEALPKGVSKNSIFNYNTARWCLLRPSRKYLRLTTKQRENGLVWLEKQIGAAYDWFGIISFIFRKNIGERKKWYCTELVQKWYKAMGIRLIERSDGLINPHPLYCSPLLSLVGSKS